MIYSLYFTMLNKVLLPGLIICFAFAILFTSIMRSASVKYNFYFDGKALPSDGLSAENVALVDYALPNPGRVLTDSPFWLLKAVRDKVWLTITLDGGKRSDLLLHLADKRLAMATILLDKGEWELGYSALTKGEKYLESALIQSSANKEEGMDTTQFLFRISVASLKHAAVIMDLEARVPEELRPKLIELENSPKKVYEDARNSLLSIGEKPPENVFDWR